MKVMARRWSGLDKDVENQAKSCLPCQEQASLHTWQWPTTHIDFAGPFLGKMFLIVVDAHSKWPEVIIMSTTNYHLNQIAIFGQLVSDNGPNLSNSYNRVESSTFEVHPITHQLTDWRNNLYKLSMKASENDGKSLNTQIASFLASYRSTPHATTSVARLPPKEGPY